MYKTIRHGENSLQYTILPQNDDFRIEGKLSSAESSASSSSKSRKNKTSCSATTTKRTPRRRRSFFAYLGLIFVCTVIVGAVLIPFLVSAECLPSPREWFLKTKAALIKSGIGAGVIGSGGGAAAATAVIAANKTYYNENNNNNKIETADNSMNSIGKTVRIFNQNGIEKFTLKVNKTATDATEDIAAQQQQQQMQQQQHHVVSEIRFETGDVAALPTPTIIVTTSLQQDEQQNKANNQNLAVAAVGSAGATIPPTPPPPPPPPPSFNNNNNNAPARIPAAFINPNSINLSAPVMFAGGSGAGIGAAGTTGGAANVATPTITTRIIQVPLLKSAAKKPIIPPVLAKTNSLPTLNINNGNVANGIAPPAVPALQTPQQIGKNNLILQTTELEKDLEQQQQQHEISNNLGNKQQQQQHDWMNAHWPYFDPSAIIQINGFKAEDSVLLPALLGFALIGMILIITVCLVARNKRTIVSSVRKRNRNDIEEQGAEDNATLLTTTNMSDDD